MSFNCRNVVSLGMQICSTSHWSIRKVLVVAIYRFQQLHEKLMGKCEKIRDKSRINPITKRIFVQD